MKKILLLSVLATALSASLGAAPTCLSVLGSDVTTLGLGCELGPYLFDNFAVTLATPGTVSGPIQLIGATTDLINSIFALTFNPNLGGPTTEDFHLTFRVTTLNGSPGVYQTGLAATGTGQGSHVQERGCTTALTQSGNCSGTVLYDYVAFAGQSLALTPNSGNVGVNQLFVWKDINSDANGTLTSFTESFQTPEPASIMLFGAGLLGLGFIRKRRKA
jgi:hypothetical protein